MTFTTWLKRQKDRNDHVGDLARESKQDENWPRRAKALAEYKSYLLENHHVCQGALRALNQAWHEWRQVEQIESRLEVDMKQIEHGTVYILETEGKFKVGHTYQDVRARVKGLQTGCPTKINIVDEIPSFFPRKLEKAIHRILEPYHLQGEWFEPPDLSFMDFIGYIHKSEITGDFGLDFSDGPPFLRQSVKIELCNFSRRADGVILLGSECITYSELEFNILRLIESLLKLLTWARQHGNLMRTPRYPKEAVQCHEK